VWESFLHDIENTHTCNMTIIFLTAVQEIFLHMVADSMLLSSQFPSVNIAPTPEK